MLELTCQSHSMCDKSVRLVKLGQDHCGDKRGNQGSDSNSVLVCRRAAFRIATVSVVRTGLYFEQISWSPGSSFF